MAVSSVTSRTSFAASTCPRAAAVPVADEPALVVAASEFRNLLGTPEFALELLRVLTERFRDADRKRIEFGATDTLGRVCARLVELAERPRPRVRPIE